MASLVVIALLALIGIGALVKLGARVARLEQWVAKLQSDAIFRNAPHPPPAVARESAPASAPIPPRPAVVVASPREPSTVPPEPRAARREAPSAPRPPREMSPVQASLEPTPL